MHSGNGDNGDGGGFQIIEERAIPDVYADSVKFELTAYGVTLELGQTRPSRPGPNAVAQHIPKLRVHMSPQHAKIMAKLFSKHMRAYEEQIGKISLPAELYKDLGVDEQW
jgi:hypothetical protein